MDTNTRLAAENQELRDMLSNLIRTTWDTFRHSRLPSQWESLAECGSEAVHLLQRLEGRPEVCTPPSVPLWVSEEWREYLKAPSTAAAVLGASTSARKRFTARENGKRGGRPPKPSHAE